ncbi:MAG: NAD(P)-dependent oxidoreductase [Hoeflea sp.]|nr:NAD(P)-dependent oxidoreductase [Hoeflea sp.]
MMRLLITGAAGGLGQGLLEFLRPHFKLRLLDIAPMPRLHPGDEVMTGDLVDPDVAARAVAGCDAVLHLAAVHGLTIPFEATLDANYRAVVNLMEAARLHQIRPVVFASSNHGWGFYPRTSAPLSETSPPRPDGWYAVSKVWGEAVMALYGDAYGMATTSLRIGNCGADVPDERRSHMWISYRDLAALVAIALQRAEAGHRAVFSCGDCPDPFFDTSGARALGFAPLDRPADHLAYAEPADEVPPEGMAGLAIGGAFAAANFNADIGKWRKS